MKRIVDLVVDRVRLIADIIIFMARLIMIGIAYSDPADRKFV